METQQNSTAQPVGCDALFGLEIACRSPKPHSAVALEDAPNWDCDYNDWDQRGCGCWHFYEGTEMDGHRCIASVRGRHGMMPVWDDGWKWKPNDQTQQLGGGK